MANVKPPSKRDERSRRTRAKIIGAARDLFLAQGYGATNLQEVADQAGVAVQTIYFVFGNKRTLFKGVVDVTIAGDLEPVSTMERDWFTTSVAAPTAAEQLRGHVRGTCDVLERVAPMTPLIAAAAAADPEIAALWPHDEDPRLTVQRTAAESLVDKPGARPGLTADLAGDLLFGLLSPELYLVFVKDRQWSRETWEEWVYETLHTQLCVDPD